MPQIVQIGDTGDEVEFPDDATPDVIQGALRKHYAPPIDPTVSNSINQPDIPPPRSLDPSTFGVGEPSDSHRTLRYLTRDIPGGMMEDAGTFARAGLTDIANMSPMSLAPSLIYGTRPEALNPNALAVLNDKPLPVDTQLSDLSRSNPNLAIAGKIGQGILGSTPLLAAGAGLPAWAGRLIAAGFSADMIRNAPEQARQLGDELGKNPQDQDPDKITSLKSSLAQSVVFAPMAGAHAGGGIPVSKGDFGKLLEKEFQNSPLNPTSLDITSPVPNRQFGLSPPNFEPFLQPGVPELADAALRERTRGIIDPTKEPALQTLRRTIEPPEIVPAPTALAEHPGGGESPFGKVSFQRQAEAPTAPRTQIATDAEREMLQKFVSEEAAQGANFENAQLPEGVSYRRPSNAPTQAEYERRLARESVERGQSQPSGHYLDEPFNAPLPEPEPQAERPREGVTIVSPGTGRAIEKPIPLSRLQRSRLRVALARGASEDVILNILRLKDKEQSQIQNRGGQNAPTERQQQEGGEQQHPPTDEGGSATEAIRGNRLPPSGPESGAAEAPKVTPEVQDFIDKFNGGEPLNTHNAVERGLQVKSLADLDALAEARRSKVSRLAEVKKQIAAEKDPEKAQALIQSMINLNPQLPREAIEAATNTGSHVEGEGSIPLKHGERPLDWRNNPEVADWLRKNAADLKITLPDELKSLGEAERPYQDATNKGAELLAKPPNLAQIKKIKYTIRPNGKFDVHLLTDFEVATKSNAGSTLGMENNLTYNELASKVGEKAATAISKHIGENKSESNGWKSGEFDLTKSNPLDKTLSKEAQSAAVTEAPTQEILPSPNSKEGILANGIKNIEALQAKLRKGPQSGQLLMGVPRAILDTALESARLALLAGKTIAEAVEAAMGHIRRNIKKADYDEAKVRGQIEREITNASGVESKSSVGKGNAPDLVSQSTSEPVRPRANATKSNAGGRSNPITQFYEKDVAPTVSKAISGVRQAGADINSALTPPNVSDVAKLTAGNMRENLADLARKGEIANKEFQKARDAFAKQPDDANLEFIRRMEKGDQQPTPELQSLSEKLRKAFDARVEQVRALGTGKLEQVIQDYFPHIWTQESVDALHGIEPKSDNIWARIFGKRPLEGPKSFLKQRTFPTTEEGINAGLEPVTHNPVELALLKMREMDKYVAGQKIFQEMKENGTAQLVPYDERAPDGYTLINDKIARAGSAGQYYAPADAARIVNNYLSPGLRGKVLFDAVRGAGNALNQAQLGLSAYHLTFTAIDSAISAVALGIKKIADSRGNPSEILKGIGSASKAVVPLYAQLENFIKSSPFLKEYYKPGAVGGETAALVDAFQKAGGRVQMDTFYKNSSVDGFWKAIHEGNYPGALLRTPFAALQSASKPIMEILVPRMKIGIFMDMARHELDRMTPEQKSDRSYVRKVLGKAWDSVDNRMGQMVYDNLFWDRTLKDLAMGSVRSVGWNLGTIREIGGGAKDATLEAVKTISQGRDIGAGNITRTPEFTHRMAYSVALPIVVGLYGAMFQYLHTGKGPEDLKDYFIPRTGQKNPDGTDERIMLPTYMKDVAPLAVAYSHGGVGGAVNRGVQMAQNKANPLISEVSQMLHNKDFYGTQIRNPDDPIVKQAQDEAKFVGLGFQPFSFRNTKQRVGDTPETKTEGVFGLLPAAKELTRTKAQEMLAEMIHAKSESGGTPQEVAARRQAVRDVAEQAKNQKDAKEQYRIMFNAGQITKRQYTDAVNKLNVATDVKMFKSLTLQEALKVYEAATLDERKELYHPLRQKMMNTRDSGNWPKGKPFPKVDAPPQ